jgi:hypothetical protein
MAKQWPRDVCLSAWAFVQRSPSISREDGFREWSNWQEGFISNRAPLRTVYCAACGERIPAKGEALYCLDAANSVDPWAPLARFIHRSPCIE